MSIEDLIFGDLELRRERREIREVEGNSAGFGLKMVLGLDLRA